MINYRYLNINPLGLVEEDCVTRAISLALDEDYYKIKKQLYLVADLFECDALCVCCYEHLLDSVYKCKRIDGVRGMTIGQFMKNYKKGIFIIRVEGHCTCVFDGVLYDSWNCRNEVIDIVWRSSY